MAINDLDRNLRVEVPLPPSVEEFVKGISAKHQLPPLSGDERRKLAADGEDEALRILRIIATRTTVRSFPGFIAHLRRQSPSPPSPSSFSRCSSLFPPPSKIPHLTPQALATEALGELEFRKQFLILNYFAGNELDKVTSAEEIRSFKDLPMAEFEEQLWERYGRRFVDEEDRVTIQARQEEVERARQGQRDAEGKLSSLEAEVQKMRVEMAAMKRDAEHYSRQEHMELEKRYRELTDVLYYKQTQLETMASEKAAAEFHLEKQLKRLQEAQAEAERSRVSRRPSSSWEEDTEMKTLEPLPLHHRHMAAANMQLQKAAKLLDSEAVRATRFLWRYPTARVMLLFYLVFVHLFLMYLLHRLQEQEDDFSAREVAKSMGLSNPTLP